jgi:hypothetical protein
VGLRHGPGADFTPIATMTEFAQRVLGAAGKSTNIELHQRMEKLGGNGPLMGGALLSFGAPLTYIGALGSTAPVAPLADFARASHAISLGDPGFTTALEFADGKLMLGLMAGFDAITYQRLVERTGGEDVLRGFVGGADLVALVNWTMIPHMTAIFAGLLENVLPFVEPRERLFFFDLADPEKRADAEIAEALQTIRRFEQFGRVTLGLNFKEAVHVGRVLGIASDSEEESPLRELSSSIRDRLQIATVVVHPRKSAACATAQGSWWVPGPYCETPLVTTGAGDHFNAGFALGQLLGLAPDECLTTGVSTSGFYVRNGKSPTVDELIGFLAS